MPAVQWALKLGPHTESQILLQVSISAAVTEATSQEHGSASPETIPKLPIFVSFHSGGSFADQGSQLGAGSGADQTPPWG